MKGSNNLEDLEAEALTTEHCILSMTRNLDWIGLIVNIWVPWEFENLFIGSGTTGSARRVSCDITDATEGPWDCRPLANLSQCNSHHASPISFSVTHTTHHQSPQCDSNDTTNLSQCDSHHASPIFHSVTHTTHHQSLTVWLTPRITSFSQCDSHHISPVSHSDSYHTSPVSQCDSHHASPISASMTHTTHHQSLSVTHTTHTVSNIMEGLHLEARTQYNY
jgi:hypothetical protein